MIETQRRSIGFPFLFLATMAVCYLAVNSTNHARGAGVEASDRYPDLRLVDDHAFGGHGDSDVLIRNASAVAVDDRGHVFIADPGLRTIHSFSPEGQYLGGIGEAGEGPGDVMSGVTIALDQRGRMLLAGVGGRVDVLDLDGRYIESFDRRNPGETVRSIVVSEAGEIAISVIDILEQTVVDLYASNFEFERALGTTYAVGEDIDWRIESTYGGGFVAEGDAGSIYYLQVAPYELRKYTFSGELIASTGVGSADFVPAPPEIERRNGRVFVPILWGSTGIVVLSDGRIVSSGYRREGKEIMSVVCLHSSDLELVGRRILSGVHAVIGADGDDRIYFACNDDESPPVARRFVHVP